MSKISIVGGGITGIASAFLAAKTAVTVFEASKNLGGILRDCEFDRHSFFSSCQYINGESEWFERMRIKEHCNKFDNIYASYTDIFHQKTFSSVFAGPVFDSKKLEVNVPNKFLGESLADRCDLYPSKISKNLKRWFRFIGVDINCTHHSSITGFQASRVYIRGQETKIRDLKEKMGGLFDMIYGLPRAANGLSVNEIFLPREGFNKIFDGHISASTENIKVEKGTTINCDVHNQRLILKTKNDNFDSDFVIWTADPTKLIYTLYGEKLDSQRFNAEVLTGFLDSEVLNPFYIQVYSFDSRVLRIYLYNMDGRGCFTIEKAFDDQSTGDVVNFCQMMISNFLDSKILEVIVRKKNVRFFSYTIKDHKALSRLWSQKKIKNLIVPDYISYSRDKKIESISQQLREANLF